MTASCTLDTEPLADEPSAIHGCKKSIHVWFEPTSGMDAITNDNGCWTYDDLTSGADGWGWCSEINGVMKVHHRPEGLKAWFFDDTNPVRTAALDAAQIRACRAAMPELVPGVEVMARRLDPAIDTLHWQKIVLSQGGAWIVNHWIAELHASADDVASYESAWEDDPSIGVPQVNARSDGTTCDARVPAAIAAVCKAVQPGGRISIVKNDGKLAYDGGCLTHVVEALNGCTR